MDEADERETVDRLLGRYVAVGSLDRSLILASGDIDRLCARAVIRLNKRASFVLLDLLAELDPIRLLAIYYALAERRRRAVLRDPAWAYAVRHAPEGIEEAIAEVDALAAEADPVTADLAKREGQAAGVVELAAARGFRRRLLRIEAGLARRVAVRVLRCRDRGRRRTRAA
jgi:hypothetical protein